MNIKLKSRLLDCVIIFITVFQSSFAFNENNNPFLDLQENPERNLEQQRLLAGTSSICDTSCLTCFGETANNCLSCYSGFILTQIGSDVIYCDPESYNDFEDFIVFGVLTPPETPEMPTLLVLANTMRYVKYLSIRLPANLERLAVSKGRSILSLRYGMHMQEEILSGFIKMPIPYIYERNSLHSSFLVNFWQEIISLGIIAVAAILFSILELISKRYKQMILQAIFTPLRIATRYNFLFLLIATSIGDVIVFSSLEFMTVNNPNGYTLKYVSFALSLLSICVILAVLCGTIVMVSKAKTARDVNVIKYLDFVKAWSGCRVLYSSFNFERLIGRYFFMIYMLRLGLPMIIACAFTFSPLTQAILQELVSITIFFCIVYFKPMKRKVNQIQLILIEGIVLILNIFILVLTIFSVYEVEASDAANVLGYIVVAGNFIINVLLFVFLFIKLGLEIKTIVSLRNKQTTLEEISAWIQLLYIPIQQGAMGFEIVFEETSTELSIQRSKLPERSLTQLQTSVSPILNEKAQTSLNTQEIMTHREPKASLELTEIAPVTHPTIVPISYEQGKLPKSNKVIANSVIKDASYTGSFIMEESQRELIQTETISKYPIPSPILNKPYRPYEPYKPLKQAKAVSIILDDPSATNESPTLPQKVSPTIQPASNRLKPSILMDNSEYAISYEHWLNKIQSTQKLQYDPNLNTNNQKKTLPKSNQSSTHIRHANQPYKSLKDYFQRVFSNPSPGSTKVAPGKR